MGITMGEFHYTAAQKQMCDVLSEHKHLQTLANSLPLNSASIAYNLREQITKDDQTTD